MVTAAVESFVTSAVSPSGATPFGLGGGITTVDVADIARVLSAAINATQQSSEVWFTATSVTVDGAKHRLRSGDRLMLYADDSEPLLAWIRSHDGGDRRWTTTTTAAARRRATASSSTARRDGEE